MKLRLEYIPFILTNLLSLVSLYLTSQFEYSRSRIQKLLFIEIIEVSDNSISLSEAFTIVSLIVIFILIILKKNYWKHLFALVLLLSALHVFKVFLYTYSFGFLALNVEGISIIILALHLALNPEVTADLKSFAISTPEIDEGRVKSFEQKYYSLTQEELELIASSEKHSSEAKAAAQNLLGNHLRK